MKDLTSLGHVEMLDTLEHGQRSFARYGVPSRILNHAVMDGVLRKKLLRAFAALSSGAVISPVERPGRRRHRSVLRGLATVVQQSPPQRFRSLTFYRCMVRAGSIKDPTARSRTCPSRSLSWIGMVRPGVPSIR